MTLRRLESILIALAAVIFTWMMWRAFRLGTLVYAQWTTYFMLALLVVPGINIRWRTPKIAKPIMWLCGFLVLLFLMAAIFLTQGDSHPFRSASTGYALVFFLCIGAACWQQTQAPGPSRQLAKNAQSPPTTGTKLAVSAAGQASTPTFLTPTTPLNDTSREPTIDDLTHLLEDFLYSRNRIAWSVPKANEIQGMICTLFAEHDELMSLAADLAQYRPSGGSDRYSYPAMRPRIEHALRLLRDPKGNWRKGLSKQSAT